MKHLAPLLNFKKSFQQAQAYHIHAIENGDENTKKAHLEHHIKSGNYNLLAKKKPQTLQGS